MKLIKINTDHYVIVDDSEIKEGDYHFDFDKNDIDTWKGNLYSNRLKCKKITHSTQPLEVKITDEGIHLPDWSKVKALSSRVVKELIGEVDIWQKFKEIDGSCQKGEYEHWLFESGYNQALEDNKEKKYTEKDMRKAYMVGKHGGVTQTYYEFDEYIQQLQPKTEWEVAFIDGKLKLK